MTHAGGVIIVALGANPSFKLLADGACRALSDQPQKPGATHSLFSCFREGQSLRFSDVLQSLVRSSIFYCNVLAVAEDRLFPSRYLADESRGKSKKGVDGWLGEKRKLSAKNRREFRNSPEGRLWWIG